MLKLGCIYMYTNKINGMKYVGQTIQSLKKRHYSHITGKDSYIDRALRKYGEDNFKLEVLEDNIGADKLDEREIYWIKYYDSFNNGYNLTKGGQGTPTYDTAKALKIIELLKYSTLTMEEIGNKMGCTIYTVSEINTGDTCHFKDVKYPIREHRITQKYTSDDFNIVAYLLKNTKYSYKKIAELTDTRFTFVNDVNRGKVNQDYKNYSIPIRENIHPRVNMTHNLALKIIEYLKKDYSAEKISEIVGVPSYTVGQINRGKMAICKTLSEEFPIQKKPHRNKLAAQKTCAKLTPDEVGEIVNLLLNTSLSLEEIARRYSVHKVTIDRINRKKIWKNLLTNYEAPIRTNPRNKIAQ